MKKILAVVALAVLAGSYVYAGSAPATGVLNSKHDINLTSGLQPDSQGRVCAFCHTPHHAEDLLGEYNPLWAHTPSAVVAQPYASATFDAGNAGAFEPLIGPSRLCMSCHDGAIAPDQHYGTLFAGTAPTGRFAGDLFGDIAVGKGGAFGNDHPIGFDVSLSSTDTALQPNVFTTATFLYAGAPGAKVISAGLYAPSGALGPKYMTCATCHDVHNKDNVANDAAGRQDAQHTDTIGGNYFVFAPQSGSQLCLSCHAK